MGYIKCVRLEMPEVNAKDEVPKLEAFLPSDCLTRLWFPPSVRGSYCAGLEVGLTSYYTARLIW